MASTGQPAGFDAHVAVAVVHERTNIACRKLVRADELQRGFAQFFRGPLERNARDFRAADKTVHVVLQAEHVAFARFFVVIAANALEDSGSVMQRMGQNMGRGLSPRHQLTVLPNVLGLFDSHVFSLPFGYANAKEQALTPGIGLAAQVIVNVLYSAPHRPHPRSGKRAIDLTGRKSA